MSDKTRTLADGYHHHNGLNTWESLGGSPPPSGTTGMYHTAILYPTRRALADALRRVLEAGIPLDGASDHAARRCTCVTRTRTAWNCIRTARQQFGPGRRRANWRCSLGGYLNGLLKEVEAAKDAPKVDEGPKDL